MVGLVRWAGALLAGMALAGCGQSDTTLSGAGSFAPQAAPQRSLATASAGKKVRTTFVIHVPPHRYRHARYVSPATRSVAITIEPGTAGQATYASNASEGTTAIDVPLAPAHYVFNFQTYDGALSGGAPTGHVLSADLNVPFTVVAGGANSVGITLQGVPASVMVVPSDREDVAGNQFSGFDLAGTFEANGTTPYVRKFSVIAADADGNDILGRGAPAITLRSSDHAVVSDGVATAAAPNTFAVTPIATGPFPQTATLAARAVPAPSSGGSTAGTNIAVRISALDAPRLYTVNNSSVGVYDEFGHAVTLEAAPFSNLVRPTQITYDSHDNSLFVYDSQGENLLRYTPDGQQTNEASIPGLVTSLSYSPGSGYLYAGLAISTGVAVYDEKIEPVSVSGNWQAQCGSVPTLPISILSDSRNGELYLMNSSAMCPVVQSYNGQGTATNDEWSIALPANDDGGLAQDPNTGYIYVTTGRTSVQVVDETGGPITTSGSFSGLTQAEGEVWDATNGWLYVYDAATGKVTAFDGQGDTIATPGGFPGLGIVGSMTMVP